MELTFLNTKKKKLKKKMFFWNLKKLVPCKRNLVSFISDPKISNRSHFLWKLEG